MIQVQQQVFLQYRNDELFLCFATMQGPLSLSTSLQMSVFRFLKIQDYKDTLALKKPKV